VDLRIALIVCPQWVAESRSVSSWTSSWRCVEFPRSSLFTGLTWQKRNDAYADKVQAVLTETAKRNSKQEMVKRAYLGMGRLKLQLQEMNYKLSYGDYNEGRVIDEQVLKRMKSEMASGRCFPESNPVVVAVDPREIDANRLAREPDDEPRPIIFTAGEQVTVYVLNGRHRLQAARVVSKQLRESCRKGEASIMEQEETMQDLSDVDKEQAEGDAARLLRAVGLMKDVIDLVEDWPVHVYNKSEFRLISQFASADTTKRRTGKTVEDLGHH
jgi:hypothetical protein